MAGPLRPNPPPPSSLMAVGTIERWKKKVKKKVIFSLMARPFTPLLMARPLREELFLIYYIDKTNTFLISRFKMQ